MELYSYIKYKNSLAKGNDIQYYFESGRLFTMIMNSSFDDIYIGGYFREVYCGKTRTFRIAKFIGSEDAYTRPQIIVVPDEPLVESRMNETSNSYGGYGNSYLFKNVIGSPVCNYYGETMNHRLYGLFGRHLIKTKELLSAPIQEDRVKNTEDSWEYPNGGILTDCQAIPMSEYEIFGENAFGIARTQEEQLPLFILMPKFKNPTKQWYWTRTSSGLHNFCHCGRTGSPTSEVASCKMGVRPRFSLG